VYAQGSHGDRERGVHNSDVRIVEYPLDLEASPTDLLSQVARLADRAWARAIAETGRLNVTTIT
jgi:hypothetical protein